MPTAGVEYRGSGLEGKWDEGVPMDASLFDERVGMPRSWASTTNEGSVQILDLWGQIRSARVLLDVEIVSIPAHLVDESVARFLGHLVVTIEA